MSLPTLTERRFPATRFGPPSLTVAMLRVTWHLVGLFVFTLGAVLVTLALADEADPKMVLFRWTAAMWMTATAVALWSVRGRPRNILRLPVPLVWPLIALLCWNAS